MVLLQLLHVFPHPFQLVSTAFWRKYPNEYSAHIKQIDVYDRKIIHIKRDNAEDKNNNSNNNNMNNDINNNELKFASSSSSSPLSSSSSSSSFPSPSPSSFSSSLSSPHVSSSDMDSTSTSTSDPCLLTHRVVCCESSLPSFMSSMGISSKCFAIETSIVNPKTHEMVIKSRNVTGSSLMVIEECCVYRPSPLDSTRTEYSQTAKIRAFLPFVSSKCENYSLKNFQNKSAEGLETIEKICQNINKNGINKLFEEIIQNKTEMETGTQQEK